MVKLPEYEIVWISMDPTISGRLLDRWKDYNMEFLKMKGYGA